jgi:hypothetical protein
VLNNVGRAALIEKIKIALVEALLEHAAACRGVVLSVHRILLGWV